MKKVLIILILTGVIFTIGCKKRRITPVLDFSENVVMGKGDYYYTNNYALNSLSL